MFPLLNLSAHARATTLLYILPEPLYPRSPMTCWQVMSFPFFHHFIALMLTRFIFSLTWFLHTVSQRIVASKFLFGFLLKIDTSLMQYIPTKVSPPSTPVTSPPPRHFFFPLDPFLPPFPLQKRTGQFEALFWSQFQCVFFYFNCIWPWMWLVLSFYHLGS